MLIDWFTVAAQIVNFLVLMWLLKRFLYKPILKTIDERNQKIRSQIEDANSTMAEAEKQRAEFEEKNRDFERQRKTMQDKVSQEMEARRKEQLENVRKEAEALRSKLQQSLAEEQQHLSDDLAKRIQKEVFAISQKVLTELASTSLEEEIGQAFLQHLTNLEHTEKQKLIPALKSSHNGNIISAFELPENLRQEVQKTINALAGENIQLSFQQNAETVAGIEITAGGYKVAWSIRHYLQSLENSLSNFIPEKETTETPAKPNSDGQAQ